MSNLFRPALKELEDRCVPTTYLWEPAVNNQGVPSNPVWSVPANWNFKTQGGDWEYQAIATPGPGDSVEFDGNPPGWFLGQSSANNNCFVDISGGVTVKDVSVKNGFTRNLILSNPLTIVDGAFILDSSFASVLGSDPLLPAQRGVLNLTQRGVLSFRRGELGNVTINTSDRSAVQVTGDSGGVRSISGSDINVNFLCNLTWISGDVAVTNSLATSRINIADSGKFVIKAAGNTWGMSVPSSQAYFIVNNDSSLVQLDASGTATIVGDYFTNDTTRLNMGILYIDGIAEQTGGTFELRNNTTIKVGGPDVALRIFSGTIAGQGTVDANLTLGYDGACPPPGGGTISPGIDIIPPMHLPGPTVRGIGTITITHAFQIFSGAMTIDVADNGDYDKVIVQGSYAALTGTLTVPNEIKYNPSKLTSLSFLTAGTIIGEFTNKYYTTINWFDMPNKKCYMWKAEKGGSDYSFLFYVYYEMP